ncbi:uncharacterized protein LOC129731653 [Wyeomyia smithii]|uniref:uncharacterized protein LOC129731653 n=1 Tax=Wyeomyia smithii TaxID=174621 RepID=UPI002467FC28|nr:uncharacterized protein LOC129731653 [Wyeomyia smithii]
MELWNKRDLAPPVMVTFKCKTKKRKEEILALTSCVSSALQYFQSQQSFEKAGAYLSRFITRWRNRFYNMHGFRLLRKLNQALLRVRSIDIVRMLTNIMSTLPSSYLDKTVELPNRAVLEYLLIRMQGLGKLFCRIIVVAKEAARYYIRYISTGNFFNLSSMFLCLLAEIWFKSRDICQRIAHFYDELVPMRSLLVDDGKEWPSESGVLLPEKFALWLGDDWTEEVLAKECEIDMLSLQPDMDLFVLLTGETEDLSSNQKVDDQVSKKANTKESTVNRSIPKTLLMDRLKSDTGETVQRQPKKPKKETKPDWSAVTQLKSKFDCKQFLDQEKLNRKENLPLALTRKAKAQTFNSFATKMKREISRMSTKDYVTMFKEELKPLVYGKK